MQLHALCLARAGARVRLVGHAGVPLIPELEAEPHVRVHRVAPPRAHRAGRSLARLAAVAFRVAGEAAALGRALVRAGPADLVLVQAPPALPALALAALAARARGARWVIDWHNEGDALLSLSLGEEHPAVGWHRRAERRLANRAQGHLCVSEALAKRLASRGLVAHVVRDAPLGTRPALEGQARMRTRRALLGQAGLPEHLAALPWAVCPGSHGRDDALDVLLGAAARLPSGASKRAEALIWVTGVGPGRAAFERELASAPASRLRIETAFFPVPDYRALLRASDLGICLHRSASGCDLPMKLAEMRGASLPPLTFDYGSCLDEVLPPGAPRIGDADALAVELERSLLAGDASRQRRAAFSQAFSGATASGFEDAWRRTALPLLDPTAAVDAADSGAPAPAAG